MWRKQDDPKASAPGSDAVVPVSRSPQGPEPLPGEARSPFGNVSEAIRVKGEITGHEDLLIEGEVQGSIRIPEGNVTVGPKGRVAADIEAREITIRGKVNGSLRGRERVQIGRTGVATGDVVTHRIVIEEGAVFRGKVEVVRGEEARLSSTEKATGTAGARPIPIRTKEGQR